MRCALETSAQLSSELRGGPRFSGLKPEFVLRWTNADGKWRWVGARRWIFSTHPTVRFELARYRFSIHKPALWSSGKLPAPGRQLFDLDHILDVEVGGDPPE